MILTTMGRDNRIFPNQCSRLDKSCMLKSRLQRRSTIRRNREKRNPSNTSRFFHSWCRRGPNIWNSHPLWLITKTRLKWNRRKNIIVLHYIGHSSLVFSKKAVLVSCGPKKWLSSGKSNRKSHLYRLWSIRGFRHRRFAKQCTHCIYMIKSQQKISLIAILQLVCSSS